MTKKDSNSKLTRRKLLTLSGTAALAGAASLYAPAIIRRAHAGDAKDAFKGEQLAVIAWSGNYELAFREHVAEQFNARYGTKVQVIGGWDQTINQIQAAPADTPPFDLIAADEYNTIAGLDAKLFMPTDQEKIANFNRIYPWFIDSRTDDAKPYGVPFGGGTTQLLVNRKAGENLDSWKVFWEPKFEGKTTLDQGAWWYTLTVPALAEGKPISTMFDWPNGANSLVESLEKLKVAKWYKDGSEAATIMQQESALLGFVYGLDSYPFIKEDPDTFYIALPKEGVAAWTDWYIKVRGTHHRELADLFSSYLLEPETQNRFIANTYMFGSLEGLTIPAHWTDYPRSNQDYANRFALLTIDGWRQLLPHFDQLNERWKQAVLKSST